MDPDVPIVIPNGIVRVLDRIIDRQGTKRSEDPRAEQAGSSSTEGMRAGRIRTALALPGQGLKEASLPAVDQRLSPIRGLGNPQGGARGQLPAFPARKLRARL